MQRLVNTFEMPPDIQPISISSTQQGLKVVWPSFATAADSDEGTMLNKRDQQVHEHESVYPWTWLRRNSYDPAMPMEEKNKKILWGSRIAQSPPTVEYEDVMKGDKGLLKWLTNIEKFGFSFVSGVPPTPEATEELTRKIAYIRETQYGRFWEFTSDLSKGDTAYTSIALGAHTDTTYFTDSCGLQLFHLLSHTGDSTETSAPSSLGGATLLVDGFYVASILRELHPEAYEILSSVRVSAHASGEKDTSGIYSTSETGFPILQHFPPLPSNPSNPDSSTLTQVRWNNDDRSVLSSLPPSVVPKFYDAIRTWHSLLSSPDSEYWVQLEPGTAVIVDNWRVLHGRSAFTGKRRMSGAFIGMDEFKAKVRGLREKEGEEASSKMDGEAGVWSVYC